MARTRRRTEQELFMTRAYPTDSVDSSRAPSPTATRSLERSQSDILDERVPLLTGSRSRVRIQSAAELPPGRVLSRHQSHHGKQTHLAHLFEAKGANNKNNQEACERQEITAVQIHGALV